MMSAILISEKKLLLDHLFNNIGGKWNVRLHDESELFAEKADEWFMVEYDENLISLYEDEERASINNFGSFPFFYHLGYNSYEAANVAIMTIQPPGPMLVDNDHGLITRLEDIRQAIESGIAWHMRRGGADG